MDNITRNNRCCYCVIIKEGCKDTLKVIAVIELDDKSHNKKSAQARDKFLESACESASLHLIRFPAKSGYVISDVADKIDSTIDSSEKHK